MHSPKDRDGRWPCPATSPAQPRHQGKRCNRFATSLAGWRCPPPLRRPENIRPIPFPDWPVDRHWRRIDREPAVGRPPLHYASIVWPEDRHGFLVGWPHYAGSEARPTGPASSNVLLLVPEQESKQEHPPGVMFGKGSHRTCPLRARAHTAPVGAPRMRTGGSRHLDDPHFFRPVSDMIWTARPIPRPGGGGRCGQGGSEIGPTRPVASSPVAARTARAHSAG